MTSDESRVTSLCFDLVTGYLSLVTETGALYLGVFEQAGSWFRFKPPLKLNAVHPKRARRQTRTPKRTRMIPATSFANRS